MPGGIQELTYGLKKPTSPTNGDLWFDAMEDNLDQLDAHNHDGETSAPIAADLHPVEGASWGSDLGGGLYRQLMTVPNDREFDDVRIEVRTAVGEVVYPDIVKVSDTTFYIYSNDNTVDFVLSYV